MQSAKGNSKKPVAQVKKPILKGSWHGKDAWKLALKRMLSMLAVTVIYLIAGMLLSFESLWGRLLSCIAVAGLVIYYQYYQGMVRGETTSAFAEISIPARRAARSVEKDAPCAAAFLRSRACLPSGGRGSVCGVCRRLRGAYASDHLHAGRAPVLDGGAHAPERIRRRAALL